MTAAPKLELGSETDDRPTGHSLYRLAIILSLPSLLAQLDGTMIIPALPRIAADFGVAPVAMSQVMTIFFLAQAIALPGCGWLVDRLGAKAACITAIVGFIGSSLLLAMSPGLNVFLLWRFSQGTAAALITASSRTAMLHVARGEKLVEVMTISTIPVLIAPTTGPAIGGLLVNFADWRWIFALNLPVGFIALGLIWSIVPTSLRRLPRRFDLKGFAITAAAVVALTVGLDGLTMPAIRVRSALVLMVGLLLVWLGQRHLLQSKSPILDLSAFGVRSFRSGAIGAGFAIRCAMRGLPFLLILLFQLHLGMSPLTAGMLILAIDAGDLALKPIVAAILRRHGFRNVLCGAALTAFVGIGALVFIGVIRAPLFIFGLLFIIGMARSLLFSAVGALTFIDLPQERLSDGAILFQVLIQLGSAVAISMASLSLQARSLGTVTGDSITMSDYRVAFGVMAAFVLLSLAGFLRMPPDAGSRGSGRP